MGLVVKIQQEKALLQQVAARSKQCGVWVTVGPTSDYCGSCVRQATHTNTKAQPQVG